MSSNTTSHSPSHTATAALAAAVAAIVSPLLQPVATERDVQAVEDLGRVQARDLFWLEGSHQQSSAIYTVPSDKILALTSAIEPGNMEGAVVFTINGVIRSVSMGYVGNAGTGASAGTTFGTGLPLPAGTTVQVLSSDGNDWLLGYLADA